MSTVKCFLYYTTKRDFMPKVIHIKTAQIALRCQWRVVFRKSDRTLTSDGVACRIGATWSLPETLSLFIGAIFVIPDQLFL